MEGKGTRFQYLLIQNIALAIFQTTATQMQRITKQITQKSQLESNS